MRSPPHAIEFVITFPLQFLLSFLMRSNLLIIIICRILYIKLLYVRQLFHFLFTTFTINVLL